MAKSKHHHIYQQCLKKNKYGYTILNVCTICGKQKDPPFKDHIDRRKDGSRMWLVHHKDSVNKYGELPIIGGDRNDTKSEQARL